MSPIEGVLCYEGLILIHICIAKTPDSWQASGARGRRVSGPASTALNRRKEGVDDMKERTRHLGRTCSTPPRGQRRKSLSCLRGVCAVPVHDALSRTSLGGYD